MSLSALHLRTLQREHALLLLREDEFATLLARGQIHLPERHREHFTRVMRRRTTWRSLVGNGRGTLVEAEISDHSVIVGSKPPVSLEPRRIAVTLIQALPKPKALALILQKAAELGASEIVLADSDFAARSSEKPERVSAILENACMQAYNPWKPQILSRALDDEANFRDVLTFFGDIEATRYLKDATPESATRIAFFNGPEGGFSTGEREFLRQRATGLLLSENVLRSETAAIIALGHFCQNP